MKGSSSETSRCPPKGYLARALLFEIAGGKRVARKVPTAAVWGRSHVTPEQVTNVKAKLLHNQLNNLGGTGLRVSLSVDASAPLTAGFNLADLVNAAGPERIHRKLLEHAEYLMSPKRLRSSSRTPPHSPMARRSAPVPFLRTSASSCDISTQFDMAPTIVRNDEPTSPARRVKSPLRLRRHSTKAAIPTANSARPKSARQPPKPHPYPSRALSHNAFQSSSLLPKSPSRSPTRLRDSRNSRPSVSEGRGADNRDRNALLRCSRESLESRAESNFAQPDYNEGSESELVRQWKNMDVGLRESKEKQVKEEVDALSTLVEETMLRSDDDVISAAAVAAQDGAAV